MLAPPRATLMASPNDEWRIVGCRYFDLTLYSYDEKLISHAERLKHCSEFPVKFYSRAHGGVVFKIPTGKKEPVRGQKKLASFLFHPFLPFAITIQHVINNNQTSSHTNFHFRK